MDKTPVGKLKTKSLIAIVIMFFVLISMGMATYSWYTISTTPTVKAVETYMQVIDPMLSIARATDESTRPPEVSNDDGAISDPQQLTWGSKITSFQNDSISVMFPAALENGELCTAEIGDDGRLGELTPLAIGKMGEDFSGNMENGVRYYTSSNRTPCAVGLGVWTRINQPNKDLYVTVSNVKLNKIINGKETEELAELSEDCIRVAFRLDNTDEIIPAEYHSKSKMYDAVLFDGSFPANDPRLVEIIIYVDGSIGGKKGAIAANVNEPLYINVNSVTFFDNQEVGDSLMYLDSIEEDSQEDTE